MPRPKKPARLELRRQKGAKPVWYIIDGTKKTSTGCSEEDAGRAEVALEDYLTERHDPRSSERSPSSILVADVVSLYAQDVVPGHAYPHETAGRLDRILSFFGDDTLADVKGARCRDYAEMRGSTGARRDLEDFQAAINHYQREGLSHADVRIWKPAPSPGRNEWLTVKEVASFVITAWKKREVQKGKETKKRPWKHYAKFALVALYTGSRAGVIYQARLGEPEEGRGWIDLEHGVFYRRMDNGRGKKRAPPVRLPDRILAHLRRWHRNGQRYVVEHNGRPVKTLKRHIANVGVEAGIEKRVTAHMFRHTAATWAMQNAADVWATAGYLGMSRETLETRYGHHHPDHMKSAGDAITKRAIVRKQSGNYRTLGEHSDIDVDEKREISNT